MAKIKKIKLGTTTYDLCDADAVHTVKQDGVTGATVNRFGTCTTSAGTAAKAVSITTGTFGLETGAKVTVKFSNKNTANNPTLNVNSTGAKNIYHNGAQIATGNNKGMLNGTVEFVYDGTRWQLIGNYVDTDSSHAINSGLKKDGETSITGSSSTGTITLGDSGVSAGYYGPESTDNPASEGSIVVPEIAVNAKGVVVDATNRTLTLPSVTITNKSSTDGTDTVYAVTNLVEGGTNGHDITATYTGLPTKAYVDKVATGHVKYLGTVSALSGLSTTAGQGDFYRVSTAFTFGSETAHVGDIVLATKDNPVANATDWDLIHTEVDTNSWVANTKTAAGYVAAPTASNPTKVWGTDASGNPAWREPTVQDSYISWGGVARTGGVTPIGMSLSEEHSGNKAAFINGDAITIEYSTDGTNYTNAGTAKADKSALFTTSAAIPIGGNTAMTADNYTKLKTRITLTAQDGTNGYIYTDLKKILINMSTAVTVNMLVETMDGNSTTWVTKGTYQVNGWSGWNDIPANFTLGGGSSQKDRPWKLRFTFSLTTYNTSYSTTKNIYGFRLFGQNSWNIPSNLGKTGHLYSYDINQNATFPGNVSVASGKKFIGNLQGTASAASTVTQNSVDDSTYYQLLLSASNSTTTETGNVNKTEGLTFNPGMSSGSSQRKGILTIGTDGYDPDSYSYGDRDSGELHVYGNIFAGAGEDGFGIYPEQDDYSELGGEYSNYWYKVHSDQIYAGDFYYKTNLNDSDRDATSLRDYFATKGHTHTTSLATNTGTSSITLSHGGKYKLTAGGTSVIFTMPGSGNTDTKVNTTLGTTTKAYVLGTATTPTSTAQGVTAVADTGVYLDTTAGQLTATTFKGALKGNADTATNVAWSGVTSKPSYYDAKAITSISRSGTTFTATYLDGTTSTFTQQDNNTKVNTTLATTTKAYLLGTSTTPTSTAQAVTAVADTGVYLDTTAGKLTATTFKGALEGNATTATTATTATKLSNTSAIGSATNPVYFTSGGVPAACTYSLNKTVPSTAVFTDTDTKVKQYTGQSSPYQYDLMFRYNQHGTADDTNYSRYSPQLSYFPYASASYDGLTTRGVLAVGDYVPLYVYDDYTNGDLDQDTEDLMYAAKGTGELHVMGSIYCTAGDDSFGIFPHLDNYGSIGSANRKWWTIYATTFYEGGSSLANKYAAKSYEGKAKIGSTAYTFKTTTTTTDTGTANYITFIL